MSVLSRHRSAGKYTVVTLILLAAMPLNIFGSDFRTDNTDILKKDTIRDDLYIFGDYSDIRGLIEGDLIAFCYDISSDGKINGNANIFAYNIDLISSVDRSARLFGYKVRVNGPIQGNALVFCYDCRIDDKTIIGRDLHFGANYAKIDGTIKGDVEGTAPEITLSGIIEGNVDFEAERLLIVSPAEIRGNLVYKCPEEAIIDDDVIIDGEITWKEQKYGSDKSEDISTPAIVKIIFLIMTLVTGLIIIFLFREHTDESVLQIHQKFWVTLAVGCLSFIVLTIGAIVPAVLIVGLPLSLIMLTAATFLFYIGKIYVSIALGHYLFSRFRSGQKTAITLEFIVGLIIMAILFTIPVLGWIIYILTFLLGTGAAVSGIISLNRKYRASTAPPSASA